MNNQVFDVYGEKLTLKELVDMCHKELSDSLQWEYKALFEGSFGFDNVAIPVGLVMKNLNNILEKMKENKFEAVIEYMADLVHQGWIVNYTYWRDNCPWENSNSYRKPYKDLGDENRNVLAKTEYKDLPSFEKQKDKIIASTLFSFIGDAVVKHQEENPTESVETVQTAEVETAEEEQHFSDRE
jgi:hypothetical protein